MDRSDVLTGDKMVYRNVVTENVKAFGHWHYGEWIAADDDDGDYNSCCWKLASKATIISILNKVCKEKENWSKSPKTNKTNQRYLLS